MMFVDSGTLGQLNPDVVSATAATAAYRAYYGIDFNNVKHYIGTIPCTGYTIASQLFIPENSCGTIFLVHGYFDHSALMRHCIQCCIELGFSVLLIDLPGHGLSTGVRVSVKSFTEYARVLDECIAYCRKWITVPLHFIGHSTGCSAGLEWMYSSQCRNGMLIDKVIFLAPLIRINGAAISVLLMKLLGRYIHNFPGPYIPSTRDSSFDTFRKNDPFRAKKLPVQWLNAAHEWEKSMRWKPVLNKSVVVVQGTSDTTVDWRYNIRFLEKKMRAVKVYYIPHARHQLHNEREDLRKNVINYVKMELLNKTDTI